MYAFSKRLINKNCNHLTCYLGWFFLGKFDSSVMIHQIFAKIYSLILPILCIVKHLWNMKVYKTFLFSLSWTKRFSVAIITKSSNQLDYQNSWCLWGVQVRYFLLNLHKYFKMEVHYQTHNVKCEFLLGLF